MPSRKFYSYVGPEAHLLRALGGPGGAKVRSLHDLKVWLRTHRSEIEDGLIPVTFVIDEDDDLRLAARRSEHVVCAAGRPVLSAGEIFFSTGEQPQIVAVSNLSTGYCPEPESWPVVEAACSRVGVRPPKSFTSEFLFRRCTVCGERNLVKDRFFFCSICEAPLPLRWNFPESPTPAVASR